MTFAEFERYERLVLLEKLMRKAEQLNEKEAIERIAKEFKQVINRRPK